MSRRTCKECNSDLSRIDRDREFHFCDGLCTACRNIAEVRKAKEVWYGKENEK